MTEPKPLRKPTFTKVNQIEPGVHGFNLYAKVISASSTKTQSYQGERQLVKAILGDSTGLVNAVFINPPEGLLKEGQVVAVRNGRSNVRKQMIEVGLDAFGRLTAEDQKIDTTGVTHNISDKKWVIDRANQRPRGEQYGRPQRNRNYNRNQEGRRDERDQRGRRDERDRRDRRDDRDRRDNDRYKSDYSRRDNYRPPRRNNYGWDRDRDYERRDNRGNRDYQRNRQYDRQYDRGYDQRDNRRDRRDYNDRKDNYGRRDQDDRREYRRGNQTYESNRNDRPRPAKKQYRETQEKN